MDTGLADTSVPLFVQSERSRREKDEGTGRPLLHSKSLQIAAELWTSDLRRRLPSVLRRLRTQSVQASALVVSVCLLFDWVKPAPALPTVGSFIF